MKNTVVELFLSEYFLISAILGKFLENDRELFFALGGIFMLPEKTVSELYVATRSGGVAEISSEKDFMQHQRIRKYAIMAGIELDNDEEVEAILNIKGGAVSTAMNFRLKSSAEVSQNLIYSNLSSAANSGLVHALRVMGLLQCEGIFLGKNLRAGIKNLSKAADWNDTVGILALLRYCPEARAYNLSRLGMIVVDTPFETLYTKAAKKYGVGGTEEIKEVRLLEKAFNSGVLKRENYEPRFARIIFCRALRFKEKEKVVFTESKELLSVIADLPLKLSFDKSETVDLSNLDAVPVKREKLHAEITRALRNADVRRMSAYRPLCICSDSKYILDMYAEAFNVNSGEMHVERIDMADLAEYDFEPTPNNIFVRSADEDRDNVYLTFFFGEISEKAASAAKNFLQSGARSKFHLNNPNVTIDLSAVLPVCFCDKRNLKLLKQYCDVLEMPEFNESEKRIAINHMLSRKKKIYRVADILIPEEMYGVLGDCDIDVVEKILDEEIRFCRVRGETVKLTKEALSEKLAQKVAGTMGFGIGGAV